MAKTHAVPVSSNQKLRQGGARADVEGKAWEPKGGAPKIVASTTRTNDTCPPECPFNGTGDHNDKQGVPICYPNDKLGRPSIFQMAEKYGTEDTTQALDKIRKETPKGSAVRHLVAGDVASEGDDYIQAANKLHKLRTDLEGWGYTHNWPKMESNEAEGWTLNASTETPEQAAEALGKGWQVVIESPEDDSLVGQRIAGRKVVACPNQVYHNVGCADCRLCRSDTPTRPIVEFKIHGQKKRGVEDAVREARASGTPVDLGLPTIKNPVREPRTEEFKGGYADPNGDALT
jgi:hypothetical protein